MINPLSVIVTDGTFTGTYTLRVRVTDRDTFVDLLNMVQEGVYPPLRYNIMHASFWLIEDDKEDGWKHSVIATSVSRYKDKSNLPRLDGIHLEGHLLPWSRWIPEGYGLFINGANMAKWYWKPLHLREEIVDAILVDGTPMRVLDIEKLCHAWESRIGLELFNSHRYYIVEQCDPLSDEQLSMIAKIARSDAYYRILRSRDTFS
jgi:hypothetical protein